MLQIKKLLKKLYTNLSGREEPAKQETNADLTINIKYLPPKPSEMDEENPDKTYKPIEYPNLKLKKKRNQIVEKLKKEEKKASNFINKTKVDVRDQLSKSKKQGNSREKQNS